ncbi:MAG: VanZ family protein [Oscillospiraceae bacterium]|nr:VanZ family protein [Oscillospiraceae bacterium]
MTTVTREERLRRVMWVIMAVYILALLRFTLFKYVPLTRLPDAFFLREREYNLIPFKAIYEIIKELSSLRQIENIAGNIILFIPFGLIFPLASVFEGETPVYGFITSLLIEAAQYGFAMGAADIDDIILNVTGVLIGYKFLYCTILLRIFKERETMLTVMAVVLGIGLTAALFVLYYAGYLVRGFPNLTF